MNRSVNPVPSKIDGMTVFNTQEVDYKKQPMFFGKPLGVQRYDSYKYPTFDRLTTQQLGYFWRPEEVSLQKDRADYHTLNEVQKHIYTSNLKYQIMLDSVQGRAPGMAFIPYCSLPELEACMEVWGFMEMIHSRSYTYIIKNVYLILQMYLILLSKILVYWNVLRVLQVHMMISLMKHSNGVKVLYGEIWISLWTHPYLF